MMNNGNDNSGVTNAMMSRRVKVAATAMAMLMLIGTTCARTVMHEEQMELERVAVSSSHQRPRSMAMTMMAYPDGEFHFESEHDNGPSPTASLSDPAFQGEFMYL
jgi:hypothetical protein